MGLIWNKAQGNISLGSLLAGGAIGASTIAGGLASKLLPKKDTSKDLFIQGEDPSRLPENKNLLDNNWADAVYKAESSGGTNTTNKNNDAGKFGWTVGFTKGTYNEIVSKAKTDKRYKSLLSQIDLDSGVEQAKASAIALANFKNTIWDENGNPVGLKYKNPVDIYTNLYNASDTKDLAKQNFIRGYK